MTRPAAPQLVPAAGLRLFILDEEGVLFSPTAQEIYSLNTAATLAWCLLEEGWGIAQIAARLGEIGAFPATEAAQGTADLFAEWRRIGLVAGGDGTTPPAAPTANPPTTNPPTGDTPPGDASSGDAPPGEAADAPSLPPFAAPTPTRTVLYRLVDRVVRLRFTTDAQFDWIGPIIDHLRVSDNLMADETADLVEVDGATVIYADGQAKWSVPRLEALAPYVKALLWQSVIRHNPLFLVFHAGVVGKGGFCLLLPAAPGSGKSSLAAALARAGFGFFSDEVALCAEDRFAIRPVPLGICVKSTGWDLLSPLYPELAAARTHRRVDGKIVRYLSPPPGPEQDGFHPVGAIVFPRYAADLETRLLPLGKAEALRRLLAECLAVRQTLDEDNVGRLVEWVKAVPCYELPNSSLAAAVGLLQSLTDSWGGAANV